MRISDSTPKADGYYMPAEYAPHEGTIMIWPVRPGSWPNGGVAAKKVFSEIAVLIAQHEKLYMLCDEEHEQEAGEYLSEKGIERIIAQMMSENFNIAVGGKMLVSDGKMDAALDSDIESDIDSDMYSDRDSELDTDMHSDKGLELDSVLKSDIKKISDNIHVLTIESDDAWARDVGPTYLLRKYTAADEASMMEYHNSKKFCTEIGSTDMNGLRDQSKEASSESEWEDKIDSRRAVNWSFNAWGGEYDGLYANWDKDDKVAARFCDMTGTDYYDASPFVLEGGSIHSDGEGTVIVTESCLLSKGRNPDCTKEQIEEKLRIYLGAEKIIWLPYGIYNDETNEHVDNVCAFTSPGNVVLAWTDDEDDPQYSMSKADLDILENVTDANGRKIYVHKLYIPKVPVTVHEDELEGYKFEEGEDVREAGERLAASYANFYIANNLVLVPQFGDENDEAAVKLLSKLMPERTVVGIYARDIILGGGNIHCITQQIPASES